MAEYSFTTHWSFDAPIEKVWEEIVHADRWPDWWPYVAKVEVLKPGNEAGVGTHLRMTWRTKLHYTLSFELRVVRVEPPILLEAHAFGELVGVGLWQLTPSATGTEVRYDWRVRTSKWWMNLVAPIARPFFSWNHARVMHEGGEALRKRLQS